MTTQTMSRAQIVVVCAQSDVRSRDSLLMHLAPLERAGIIQVWHDGQLRPGDSSTTVARTQLEQADIVLVLMTAEFLAGRGTLWDATTATVKKRIEAGTLRVVPILIRPVGLADTPFEHLRALPSDGRPVSLWRDKDAAWNDIVDDVRRLFSSRDVLQHGTGEETPHPTPTSTSVDLVAPTLGEKRGPKPHRYQRYYWLAAALPVIAAAASGWIFAYARPAGRSSIAPDHFRTADRTASWERPGPPEGMVLVPGGPFDKSKLAPFYVDITEVTVTAYKRCISAGQCGPLAPTTYWRKQSEDERQRLDPHCAVNRPDREDYPVNCVTWQDATVFCKSLGKRLPTRIEWEYLARGGPGGLRYPWGNQDPSDDLICWNRSKSLEALKLTPEEAGLCPVASRPPGVYGLFDVVGNVLEWTSTSSCEPPSSDPACAELKWHGGGSWATDKAEKLAGLHSWQGTRSQLIGFRCVADP